MFIFALVYKLLGSLSICKHIFRQKNESKKMSEDWLADQMDESLRDYLDGYFRGSTQLPFKLRVILSNKLLNLTNHLHFKKSMRNLT